MGEINIFYAKTHLSGLIDQVYSEHKSFIITRRGVKVAQLVPVGLEQEQSVADIIKELQALGDEVAGVNICLKDIKKMKDEGRK